MNPECLPARADALKPKRVIREVAKGAFKMAKTATIILLASVSHGRPSADAQTLAAKQPSRSLYAATQNGTFTSKNPGCKDAEGVIDALRAQTESLKEQTRALMEQRKNITKLEFLLDEQEFKLKDNTASKAANISSQFGSQINRDSRRPSLNYPGTSVFPEGRLRVSREDLLLEGTAQHLLNATNRISSQIIQMEQTCSVR